MAVHQEEKRRRSNKRPRRRSTTGRRRLYRQRRLIVAALTLSVIATLVFAVFSQSPEASREAPPINPNSASPDAVLAEASGVAISTPIRPAEITGLGYHPDGEALLKMEPRGSNLSASGITSLFGGGTAERISYYTMSPAERPGPRTGALDVGAEAGTSVYSPVDGVITAIRQAPSLPEASIVEIKPSGHPNLRVSVTLVQNVEKGVGVESNVKAGMTQLGEAADVAEVLKPQLSYYTPGEGNHVTIYLSRITG